MAQPTPPKVNTQFASIVEERIRRVKEMLRSITHNTPHDIPDSLLPDQVNYVVMKLNHIPSRKDHLAITPKASEGIY